MHNRTLRNRNGKVLSKMKKEIYYFGNNKSLDLSRILIYLLMDKVFGVFHIDLILDNS
jgi:hypothetical protein